MGPEMDGEKIMRADGHHLFIYVPFFFIFEALGSHLYNVNKQLEPSEHNQKDTARLIWGFVVIFFPSEQTKTG